MINGKTYYDILGLDKYGVRENGERVSQESIQRRYYTLKYGSIYEERLPYWLLGPVEEAYRVLSDNELRNEYDRQLANGNFVNTSVGASTPAPEQEVPEQETPEQEASEQAAPEQEAPEQETPEQEAPEQEAPEQEAPEQEAPAQETPEQETPEQETPEQEEQEPEQETPKYKVSQEKIENAKQEAEKNESIRAANRKQRISNALIIGGSTLFAGPIGGIVAAVILKKKGKFKLQKIESKGIIKEIKTEESGFIAEENKKLEEKIDTLLKSPLSNNQSRYELEIAKLRYQNQIDLLQRRIDFQKGQMDLLGYKVNNRLHLLALEFTLKAAIKTLELKQNSAKFKMGVLNSYQPNQDKKDKLTELTSELQELESRQQNLNTQEKNRMNIRLTKLNQKKIGLIKKMSLKKNGISRKQLGVALVSSIKNKFSSPVVEQPEEQQEESVRTR